MKSKQILKIIGAVVVAVILVYSFIPGNSIPYPQEILNQREEIHDFMGVRAPRNQADGRVQGLFRFGYAKPAAPSPRWPLETRVIAADA